MKWFITLLANATKGVQEEIQLDGKGNSQGIVQEIKFGHATKWYKHKLVSVQENVTQKFIWVLR